jgi:hypothetical protein
MKNNIKILSFSLSSLFLLSCKHDKTVNEKLIIEEYGLKSPTTELQLNKIKTWEGLTHRIDSLNCIQIIPKITITKNNKRKSIFFLNGCYYSSPVRTIQPNDAICIINDTIFKSDDIIYPLDSLTNVLKKDYNNNGKNPKWSDNPESLVIYLSYSKFEKEKLLSTLDKLTDSYKQVSGKKDIEILLMDIEFFRIVQDLAPPPPPPPIPTNE